MKSTSAWRRAFGEFCLLSVVLLIMVVAFYHSTPRGSNEPIWAQRYEILLKKANVWAK